MASCPKSVIEHLENILDASWFDEQEDYLAHVENQSVKAHIFESMVVVRHWIESIQTPTQTAFTGVCPQCGKHDGRYDIGRAHWFLCHEHGLKWCAGVSFLTPNVEENEADWVANRKILSSYREILNA